MDLEFQCKFVTLAHIFQCYSEMFNPVWSKQVDPACLARMHITLSCSATFWLLVAWHELSYLIYVQKCVIHELPWWQLIEHYRSILAFMENLKGPAELNWGIGTMVSFGSFLHKYPAGNKSNKQNPYCLLPKEGVTKTQTCHVSKGSDHVLSTYLKEDTNFRL